MSDRISIVLDGDEYIDFSKIEVDVSFLNMCRAFKADVSLPNSAFTDYPVKMGQKFIVKVNGNNVVSGRIEKMSVRQTKNERVLTIAGRDYLRDLVDSTIDASILQPFNGNITFDNLCRQVVAKIGLNVEVISYVTEQLLFKKDDYISPGVGEKLSDYLQKYANKVQVFLNSDGDGNLLIQRGDRPQPIANFLSADFGDTQDNRILSSEVTYCSDVLFSQYRCHCQQQTLNVYTSQVSNSTDFENDISGVLGTATNNTVEASRIYNFISSTSLDKEIAAKRAKWEANYALSKYVTYTCDVAGYTYDGSNIWEPNQTVEIDDPLAGIKGATMLLCSVTYHSDLNNGNTCSLHFVPKDSFTLLAQREQNDKDSQNLGKVYGSDQ